MSGERQRFSKMKSKVPGISGIAWHFATPPRMRGTFADQIAKAGRDGTTPAYAGNILKISHF